MNLKSKIILRHQTRQYGGIAVPRSIAGKVNHSMD